LFGNNDDQVTFFLSKIKEFLHDPLEISFPPEQSQLLWSYEVAMRHGTWAAQL